ncbi:MAG: hypothetical protein AAFZ65_05260 [Planctomycetota bacterium]
MQSSRRWWFLLGILGLLAGSLATFADRPEPGAVAAPGAAEAKPSVDLQSADLRVGEVGIPHLATPPAVVEPSVERAAVTSGWPLEVEVRGLEVGGVLGSSGTLVQLGSLQGNGGFIPLGPVRFRADGPHPMVDHLSPYSTTVTASDNVARMVVPEGVDPVTVRVDGPIGYRGALATATRETGRLVVDLVPILPVRIHFPGLAPRASHFGIARRASKATEPGDGPARSAKVVPLDRFGSATFEFRPESGPLPFSLQWRDPSEVQGPMVVLSGTVHVTPEQREFSFPDVVSHAVQIVPLGIDGPYRLEFKLAHPSDIDLPHLGGWSGGYGLYGGLTFQSEPDGRLFVELLAGSATHVKLESKSLGEVSLESFEVGQSGVAILAQVD